MPADLKIPAIGESITEVQISEWLKSDGDAVKKDEVVAVIDSEKSTFELSAPETGRLRIVHQAGDTVKVGEVVARVESAGAEENVPEAKSPPPAGNKKAAPVEAEPQPTIRIKKKKAPSQAEKKATKAEGEEKREGGNQESAEAKNLVEGKERDQTEEPPTIPPLAEEKVKPDKPELLTANKAKSKTADGQEKIVTMTMLRRTAARRLTEARQQMAMLTTFNEADMSAVMVLRTEHQAAFEKKHQTKLGFMSFFTKAVVDALKQFPQLNAEIRGSDLVYHHHFDIGVAIATERGLVVPVLRNAEQMSFAEIEKAIGEFGQRAKEGKLNPSDLEGGTFTITNGGVFGSLLSTPIINPPQSGILGMHSIAERPVAVRGEVVIRPMMYLALTYDHRIVDGREAVLFLRRIKEVIENPARLLIGI